MLDPARFPLSGFDHARAELILQESDVARRAEIRAGDRRIRQALWTNRLHDGTPVISAKKKRNSHTSGNRIAWRETHLLNKAITPSFIVKYLDQYVIGQDDAKKTVAVTVYSHFKKIAKSQQDGTPITKSNVLLIGPSGTGKTLLCETLSLVLGVPFVTAEATALAQSRYVNEEIEAVLQRLVDKTGGDIAASQHGIVFIDEIDKLKAIDGQPRSVSGESVQHALLKIMEGAAVKLVNGRYIDTTNILFICGGAFVGLDEIMAQSNAYRYISISKDESQQM